jgi:hypothetical protein
MQGSLNLGLVLLKLPPPVAAAAAAAAPGGVGPLGPDFYAAVAAAVAAASAARPAAAPRPPKELTWPKVPKTYVPSLSPTSNAEDFATWYQSYAQLARHVDAAYRVQHLMGAVSDEVRKNCEGWAVTQGTEVTRMAIEDVCDYIALTYDRPDGKHRRIIRYLGMQPGQGGLAQYLRDRTEKRHLLARDGVALAPQVECALLVHSLSAPLQAALVKDPGWSEMGREELEQHLLAKEKALIIQKSVKPGASEAKWQRGQPSRWPRTAGRSSPAPDNSQFRHRSNLNLMAAQNSLKRKSRDTEKPVKAADTLAALGGGAPRISQKDMRRFYTEDQWRTRTNVAKPADCSNPRNAHLFNKDKDTDGKPYCLRCRVTGHTLDVCRKSAPQRRSRTSGKGKGSGSSSAWP